MGGVARCAQRWDGLVIGRDVRPHTRVLIASIAGMMLVTALPLHAQRARDPWFGRDKAKHFIASTAIQSLAYAVFRRHDTPRNHALWRATAVTAAVGIGKELWDARGHGDPSWRDLAWDGAGIVVGSGLVFALDRPARSNSLQRASN